MNAFKNVTKSNNNTILGRNKIKSSSKNFKSMLSKKQTPQQTITPGRTNIFIGRT